MVGKCLLMGTGISIISTGLYFCITYTKPNNYNDNNMKNEYLTIFSIILVVSFLILYIFSNNSEILMNTNVSNNYPNNKPPF